jgi:3-methyladenine DNA glycosylase/8-oxoguanine DNA glycosylase
VYDVVVPVVLEQRVTGVEARRAWRNLVRRHGEPAPGPRPLWLSPSPSVVARLSDWQRHRLGVESARGVTMSLVAGESGRLQRAAESPAPALARRLRALPGVGPWTTAVVTHLVQGDPDAVPVADYHICHEVTYAFTGEPRGSDERMLELLEPFRGQRGRVVRLVLAGMPSRARTAPRARIPDRILAEDAELSPRRSRARRSSLGAR